MPIDSATVGDYLVTLTTIECINNQQTWTYQVTRIDEEGPEISNLAIELCDPEHTVLFASKNGVVATIINDSAVSISVEIGNPNVGQGQGNCLADQTPTVEKQIKWNNLSDDQVAPPPGEGLLDFTLQGCYTTRDVRIAIKAGSAQGQEGCSVTTILGPSCVLQNGRGIDLFNLEEN